MPSTVPPPAESPLPLVDDAPLPTPFTPVLEPPAPALPPSAVAPGLDVAPAPGPPTPSPSDPWEDNRSAPLTVVPQPARASTAQPLTRASACRRPRITA